MYVGVGSIGFFDGSRSFHIYPLGWKEKVNIGYIRYIGKVHKVYLDSYQIEEWWSQCLESSTRTLVYQGYSDYFRKAEAVKAGGGGGIFFLIF